MPSEADRVITLEGNKLRYLMGGSPTDDPNCWDSLDWIRLEGAAQKLQEVTGRTCKWYIGGDVWIPKWKLRRYNARWTKLAPPTELLY